MLPFALLLSLLILVNSFLRPLLLPHPVMQAPFRYRPAPPPGYAYPQAYTYPPQQSAPYTPSTAASALGLLTAWSSFMPILLILVAVAVILATIIWGPDVMKSKPKAKVISMGIQSGIVLGLFAVVYNVIASTSAFTEVEKSYAHMMLVLVTALLVWNYLSHQLSVVQKPSDGLDPKTSRSSSSRSSSSSSRDPSTSSSSRSSLSASRSSSSSTAAGSSSSLKVPSASSAGPSSARPSSSSRSASSSSLSSNAKPEEPANNPDPWNKAHPSAYLTTPKAPPRIWPFPIGFASLLKPKDDGKNDVLWWESGTPMEAGTIDIDGTASPGETGAAAAEAAAEIKSRSEKTSTTVKAPNGVEKTTVVDKKSSSTTSTASGPDLDKYLAKIDERLAKANLSPEETAKMRKKMLAKVTETQGAAASSSKISTQTLPPGLGPPPLDELSEYLPPVLAAAPGTSAKILRWQDEEDEEAAIADPQRPKSRAINAALGASPKSGLEYAGPSSDDLAAALATSRGPVETPEERAARKAQQAASASKPSETPEQRAARKALESAGSPASSSSRPVETPEQRAARKAAEVQAGKRSTSTETTSSRTLLDSQGNPVATASTRSSSSTSATIPTGPDPDNGPDNDEELELLKKKRLVKHVKMLVCVTAVAFFNYQVGFLCFVGLVLFLIDDLTSPVAAADVPASSPPAEPAVAAPTSRSSSSSSRPSTPSSGSTSKSSSSSSGRVLTDKEKAALPTSTKPKGEDGSNSSLPIMSMMYMSTPNAKIPGVWKSPEHLVQVHGPNNPLLGSFHRP